MQSLAGDVDFDGAITVTDALIALRFAAKLAVPQQADYAVGDMDSDGSLTVTDSLAILRIRARLV